MVQRRYHGGIEPLTIGEMQTIAATRGGRCLSAEYVNNRTPLEWECAEGHRWWATPGSVKNLSSWCGVCAWKKPRRRLRKTIDDMQALAGKHGGRCLSGIYTNAHVALGWECAQGHRWFARPNKISLGSWCPICAVQRLRLTLADVGRLAGERGGQCLSTEYVNVDTPLEFQCAAGHRWHATVSNVRSGKWCPKCSRERCRSTIGAMRALAASHGGECLSETYEHSRRPLRWRCASGHEWETTADNAKQCRRSKPCSRLPGNGAGAV